MMPYPYAKVREDVAPLSTDDGSSVLSLSRMLRGSSQGSGGIESLLAEHAKNNDIRKLLGLGDAELPDWVKEKQRHTARDTQEGTGQGRSPIPSIFSEVLGG